MRRVLRWILVLILAVCIGLAARQWAVSVVRVAGNSMADTLLSGDVVLTTRLGYTLGKTPEFGDVVECTFPGREGRYIKRVIGLPGDVIEFSSGQLYRNGELVSEPYVSSETEDMIIELGEDEYFVLGDNRAESYDSRMEDMGCITQDCILAQVRVILWPLNRIGIVE